MIELQNLTVEQLRKAVSIKEEIERLQGEVAAIAKGLEFSITAKGRGRKKMPRAGRAAIAAAQKARWAKILASAPMVKVKIVKADPAPKKRGKASSESLTRIAADPVAALLALTRGDHGRIATLRPEEDGSPTKKRRKMSAAGRAKIAAAARARWARLRAEKKKG
jgi:hypothetical protein